MESTYRITSLNIGLPSAIQYQGKEIITGIDKKPTDEVIYLSKLNLSGDKQADLINHGGVDKAVCAYSYKHYSYWEKQLNVTLSIAAFGENLTLEYLTEDQVHIGDIFEFGEAILQVTQPRQPCYKLAAKLKQPQMVQLVRDTGYTGFYFRVLKEGHVSKEDQLKLIEADPNKQSIAMVNRLLFIDKSNREGIKALLKVDALADKLRESFEKKLAKISK